MVKHIERASVFRRRREGKTNYRRRRRAVISRRPLLNVFISDKNTLLQVVQPKPEGDAVLCSAHSRELLEHGWKASRRNIPAAYLTGLLMGSRAKSLGVKDAILYTNVKSYHPGGRVASAVKGVVDAGFKLAVDEETFPNEDIISGKHIASYAAQLKGADLESYQRKFSGLLKAGVTPEDLPAHFEDVKGSILKVKVEK